VAVLLNEDAEVLRAGSQAGYRCFTSTEEFRRYVNDEVLGQYDSNVVQDHLAEPGVSKAGQTEDGVATAAV